MSKKKDSTPFSLFQKQVYKNNEDFDETREELKIKDDNDSDSQGNNYNNKDKKNSDVKEEAKEETTSNTNQVKLNKQRKRSTLKI